MHYYCSYFHGEYRVGTKYQKRPTHAKKSKTQKQSNKEAWRTHRGIDKDNKKSYDCWGSYKKSCIKKGHKSHRMWARMNLHAENYDVFYDNEVKKFIDPWDWD